MVKFDEQAGWVRADVYSMIGYPIFMVVVLTMFGDFFVGEGLLKGWYSSPYVVLVAVAANRICVVSGLWAALLSIAAHNYVFVGTRWGWDVPMIEQIIAYVSMFVVVYAVGRRDRPRPPLIPPMQGEALPFTSIHPGNGADDSPKRRCFWETIPTGRWSYDSQVGAEYARIYLDQIRRGVTAPLLAWVVKDMIAKGRFSGVEAGFLGVVGRSVATSGGLSLVVICDQNNADQV